MIVQRSEVVTLEEYVTKSCELFGRWHGAKTLFFRGVADSSFSLLPGVFRGHHPESDYSHSFRASAAIMGETPDHNDLDRWLFIMQHHCLPTRLLDWTESPLVALHFALHQNRSESDAAVLVMSPTLLNEKILGQRFFPDRNDFNYKYRFIKAFYRNPSVLPWDIGIDLDSIAEKMLPLAIRPVITHQRMVSQRASFTVHGDDARSIEEIFKARSLRDMLRSFIIPAKHKRKIETDLKKVGITRSVVFPDLIGIAEDIMSRTRREIL